MEVGFRFEAYCTTLGILSSVVRASYERWEVFDFVTVGFDIFEGF